MMGVDRSRGSKWPFVKPATERRVALVVVIVFVVAGTAWILLTDLLLYSVIHDQVAVARFETAKGWVFVALSALLLYGVTFRSAAQLIKAHRAIAAVLESIGDGVLVLGPDRAVAYANPAAVQLLGAANANEFRGMSAPEFSRRYRVSYPDGRLVPPDQFVSQRVFTEAGPLRYKAVLHRPGGQEVVCSCTAAGVRPEIGEPADIVVSVMHDITATEQQERLREELFSGAAHALKTPVAVIKSASQFLADGVPPNLRDSTRMIERQCARIELSADNLLLFSRIRSGTLHLYPAEVELGPLVEDVAGDADRLFQAHDIQVQAADRVRVNADRERIVVVLRNAIHVALRLSRPDGAITVLLKRCDLDAQIDVSCQRDSTEDETAGHIGCVWCDFDELGVSRHVTATLVEAHGGTLTEQSDADSATIRIRLPAIAERPT